MDRTKASDAFNAGSIPVGCIEKFERIVMDNKKITFKDVLHEIKEFILEHSKLFVPCILVVGVIVTVLVAVNANQREELEQEAEAARVVAETEAAPSANADVIETPQFELEENAHPEINNVVKEYYDAQVSGDIDKISAMNSYLNDIEKIKIQELSKYIEAYPEINVYTKPGLTENAYVAYVCSEVKFKDVEKTMPGMQTYYIGTDPDGNYFVNDGTYDEAIYEYIKNVTLQDDVVDLNNKVVVEYNDLLAEDEDINVFIAYLKEKVNEEVGVILAQVETPEVEEEVTEEPEDAQVVTTTIVTKVRAKERVNIRKSDSQDADKAGTADANQEFSLIEKKDNGWTEIEYNGESAFIKSDYLEDVDAITVEINDNNENEDDTQNDGEDNAQTAENTTLDGKVKVNDSSVRIRKEPNTTSDILATLSKGTELDFVEESGEWSKIKYKNQFGYIKSEFLDRVD